MPLSIPVNSVTVAGGYHPYVPFREASRTVRNPQITTFLLFLKGSLKRTIARRSSPFAFLLPLSASLCLLRLEISLVVGMAERTDKQSGIVHNFDCVPTVTFGWMSRYLLILSK